MLLIALGGIIFAVLRWKRHPRVSLMTVLALIVYLFDAVFYSVFLYWLPELTGSMRLSSDTMRWVYSSIYFCEDIVYAAIILLIVAAAFTGRQKRPSAATVP
jgi:ABC-type multidrug transport system permease subunit